MTSDVASLFARSFEMEGLGRFNYIRNSVKATVDAYDGEVHMYRLRSRRSPDSGLSAPVSRFVYTRLRHARRSAGPCPRAGDDVSRAGGNVSHLSHARPGILLQSRRSVGPRHVHQRPGRPAATPSPPTYMIATLPGENAPEFLLTIPFTPRNKQNLIGMMVAALRRRTSGRDRFSAASQAGNYLRTAAG